MTESASAAERDRFTFEWPDPAYEGLWWMRDQMHHPLPKTPYTESVDLHSFADGATAGYRAFNVPVRLRAMTLHGYWYIGVEIGDTDVNAWMPRAQAAVLGQLGRMLEIWRETYLPEVLALNAELRDFDYDGAATEQLMAQLDRSVAIRVRQWEIHMLAVAPVFLAAGQLQEMWAQSFGKERAAEALTLLQGFPNKTVEAGCELWKLSREALADPEVAKVIAEAPVRRVLPLLRTTEGGRAFAARLDAYLEVYGWRSGAFELLDPSWIEDPTVVINTLRDFIKEADEADPARHAARAAAERDELLARVGPEIDALPQGPILRAVIPMAQQYLPLQEDHNFYIDQMNTVLMRWPALAAGRRLAAADALAVAEDVFWLTLDEVQEALREPRVRAWAELVVERRDEWRRRCEMRPPANVGTPLPEDLAQNAAIAGFFGEQVEQDETSNVLNGAPASRGRATGRAVVVHTLDGADRLEPGDILVCEMTMPAWTPLFAVAAGVVTDTGGALSHSAIVAREYGIPAVVGTTSGTRRIKDGDRVTVDGTAGTVTIEAAAPS